MSSFKLERLYPAVPVTERAFKFHIHLDPKGEWMAYPVSNTVVVRNLKDASKTYSVNYHVKKVSCAVFSPSGNYIASGDVEGNIRIWAHDHEEKLLKYEYRPVSFHIHDMAWTGDNQKIAVVGINSQSPIYAFTWDTGNKLGEFHTATTQHFTLDMKKNRPYGLVCADDRGTIRHYVGTPYKQDKFIDIEPLPIYCVRISPDEKTVAICNTDAKVYLYEERTLELKGELVDTTLKKPKAHEGGVYGLCWSLDSKTLVTASADKSIKLWDVESKTMKHKIQIGSKIEFQQLGCAWSSSLEEIISISFSGFINFIKFDGTLTEKRIEGMQNPIIVSCCIPSTDSTGGRIKKIFVGCCTGRVCQLDVAGTEEFSMITEGPGVIPGNNSIVTLSALSSDEIASCIDPKSLYFIKPSTSQFIKELTIPLANSPLCSGTFVSDTTPVLVIGNNVGITVVKDHKIVQEIVLKTSIRAVAISQDGKTLVVGSEDMKVMIFDLDPTSATPVKSPEAPKHKITVLEPTKLLTFSPDGTTLFAIANNCTITSYFTSNFECTKKAWRSSLGTPSSVNWNPDGTKFGVMLLNGKLFIFEAENPNRRHEYVAHRGTSACGVFWDSENVLFTVGSSDVVVKKISI